MPDDPETMSNGSTFPCFLFSNLCRRLVLRWRASESDSAVPHVDCRDAKGDNHSIAIGNCSSPPSLFESSCSRSEADAQVSLSATDQGDPPINADSSDGTSITSINAARGSIDEQSCRSSLAPSEDMCIFVWHPAPIHHKRVPCYASALEIADDGNEAETLSLHTRTEAGDTAQYISTHQGSDVLRRLDCGAVARYRCGTSMHGCDEVRIGCGDEIPRWCKGSELRYVLCAESFESLDVAASVADATARAISMWPNVGVYFKQVARDEPAAFAIKYCGFRSRRRRVYARSFFPQDSPGELVVYQDALDRADYLDNILAHELGHILGLRHEFAAEKEKDNRSVLFGSENDLSVMNYSDHPSKLQVGKQDCEELATFYAYKQAVYGGLPIVDVEPHLHIFSSVSAAPASRDLSPNKLSSAKNGYIGCSIL
ncbi:matrix metallo ase-11, partial [Trichoderma arundinaceum]